MTKIDQIAYQPNRDDPFDVSDDEINDDNVDMAVDNAFPKAPKRKRTKKLKREYTCSKCHLIFYEKDDLERHCSNPDECEGQDANSRFILDIKKKYNTALARLEFQVQKNSVTLGPIEEMEKYANILHSMGAMEFSQLSEVQLTMNNLRQELHDLTA